MRSMLKKIMFDTIINLNIVKINNFNTYWKFQRNHCVKNYKIIQLHVDTIK